MKVAFEEFHLWFQFALALISAGKVRSLDCLQLLSVILVRTLEVSGLSTRADK